MIGIAEARLQNLSDIYKTSSCQNCMMREVDGIDGGFLMQSLTHLGTFEGLIEHAQTNIAAIATKARQLIQNFHPDTVEVSRNGEKTAAYGFGPKKMSEAYAFISVHREHVNLGFYHGTQLNDSSALLEGTGSLIRHIKLKRTEDLDNPALQDLLQQAIIERKEALSL